MKNTIYIICDVILVTLILFWPWSNQTFMTEVPPLSIGFEKSLIQTPITEKQQILDEVNFVPILMFHYIRDPGKLPIDDSTGRSLSVSSNQLNEFLEEISNEQIKMISLKTIVREKIKRRSIVLTFDDGYKDFFTQAWPILKKYQAKATVFVITARINQPGYLSAQEIQELSRSGIEIASHTQSHPNLKNTSEANLKLQLEKSKSDLESLIGQPVYSLAYPSGQFNEQVVQAVADANYLAAVTTQEGIADLEQAEFLALPRIRMRTKTDLNKTLSSLGFLFSD